MDPKLERSNIYASDEFLILIILRFGEIPRKGKNTFRVQRVQAVTLPTFNLNDPRSLEAFASSDEESEGSTQAALDESDTSELGDDAIELDATFILEDTRLKLIE